jgi:hypothetical protein
MTQKSVTFPKKVNCFKHIFCYFPHFCKVCKQPSDFCTTFKNVKNRPTLLIIHFYIEILFDPSLFSVSFETNLFVSRVSTEVTFWNSAEYGILCGSDFNSAEFRGSIECLIPRNSAKFRAFLNTELSIYFFSVIIFFVNSVLYFKVIINCT